jgi:hypothetical protein
MENLLKLSEETLNEIVDQEARKLVGTCLKRIEIPMEIKERTGKEVILNKEELENVKSQLKNLIYESMRTVRDMVRVSGKESIRLVIKK